ncbi:SpvB/TcaC N-terminal domain-containing protein [Pseudomonas sp. T1.Ur]|uniref:SpvB/TcaC N-terminal domain-containing protein n=1 Tax=Pseudomonas sp. T1.Ur TaxID=2928704 RepID=UPI00201E02AB|nr:SpvB/TcaC N-terminal domain-containing protein [Pseudomonas sp. T1.Ur]MCL6703595.1 toxin [Pseudomonas sp. T1.Ur]
MNTASEPSGIEIPTLPKAGGALTGLGKGWGEIGASGTATFELGLPISAGRGYAPALALIYQSTAGNSPFGLGWNVPLGAISRRTREGVPTYTQRDVILGPDAQPLLPEQDVKGAVVETFHARFNGLELDTTYTVTRHFPRVESDFSRIEHWRSDDDPAGFWLVQGANGDLHLYGKTMLARIADPDNPEKVAQWLLQESLNPVGEHIYYHYREESQRTQYPRDTRAQRYLASVHYGNFSATNDEHLYLWLGNIPVQVKWHFELVLDYGERTTAIDQTPSHHAEGNGMLRQDPFSSFAYGFELRTLRLCRQVLMFHYFPSETSMGPAPVLVRRLLLEHDVTEGSFSLLTGAHEQGIDPTGRLWSHPPLELLYRTGRLKRDLHRHEQLTAPGLNDGQRYFLADLFGEGLPGLLYRDDKCWFYREPLRTQGDDLTYGPPRALPNVPVADTSRPVRQMLLDITGDGQLEWLVTRPGMSGFFSLDSGGTWSGFMPFNAFPVEFLHPQGRLANVMGAGFLDFVMIGPRSVRLYASRRQDGFAGETEVPRADDDDALPLITHSATELVVFSDVLGSGQQHLVRIRHNEVKCWPNLGAGRFGKGWVFATLPFAYESFQASRVLLADLDGSGATDLVYVETDGFTILRNQGGNGLALHAVRVKWPDGVRYDDHCQVSIADLQGLGFPSLVLSVPHPSPRHWRYDFFVSKPYLLRQTENNMGTRTLIDYRSSAQEWLDEKQELNRGDVPAVCRVPFAVPLVSRQTVLDEITGSRHTQTFSYRQGYYDRREHVFRGYGLLLHRDAEHNPSDPPEEGYSAPVLTKTWFHNGQSVDMPGDGHSDHDPQALVLGKTLLSRHRASGSLPAEQHDDLIDAPDTSQLDEARHALSGATLRVEVWANGATPQDGPYCVQHHRYLVRQLPYEKGTQRYARTLVLNLESVGYRYERVADDPVCQHQVNLRWDNYGSPVHHVTVHHARRKTANDDPPALLTNSHQQQWWRDTHDEAQQAYYLSETLAQFIHQAAPQRWRLGLPWRLRGNVLVLDKQTHPHLTPANFSYEQLLDETTGPLSSQAKRELSALSVQHYREPGTAASTLAAGMASFQGLIDHVQSAELDPKALEVYRDIPDLPPYPSKAFEQKLQDIGYRPMDLFFFANEEEATQTDHGLWSIQRSFSRYAPVRQFCRVRASKPTPDHDETVLIHDRYACLLTDIKLPDGCVTQVKSDYRTLLPITITDPNGTMQEAVYDGFGQVLASAFNGREQDQPIGFYIHDRYVRPMDDTPANAIAAPRTLLQDAATAHAYDRFSWMGSVAWHPAMRQDWVTQGYLLPSGHIRATGRQRLARRLPDLSSSELTLKAIIDETPREPMHAVQLQADRYPHDPEQQIRINLTCWDGFGRVLQSKQKTEPGPAFAVDKDGNLKADPSAAQGGQPGPGQILSVPADPRWRVSERVEYNNKGLTIRVYRPYFADTHRYINDQSLRELGYSDRQFHDPLGRPTRTLTANGCMRRVTYWAWYTVNEDENDTWEEMQGDTTETTETT